MPRPAIRSATVLSRWTIFNPQISRHVQGSTPRRVQGSISRHVQGPYFIRTSSNPPPWKATVSFNLVFRVSDVPRRIFLIPKLGEYRSRWSWAWQTVFLQSVLQAGFPTSPGLRLTSSIVCRRLFRVESLPVLRRVQASGALFRTHLISESNSQ